MNSPYYGDPQKDNPNFGKLSHFRIYRESLFSGSCDLIMSAAAISKPVLQSSPSSACHVMVESATVHALEVSAHTDLHCWGNIIADATAQVR